MLCCQGREKRGEEEEKECKTRGVDTTQYGIFLPKTKRGRKMARKKK